MSFFTVKSKEDKNGNTTIFPEFKVSSSNDLMVKGRDFYAIWDEKNQVWSKNEADVVHIVDNAMGEAEREKGLPCDVKWMVNYSTNSWHSFKKYCYDTFEYWHPLDSTLKFQNETLTREDYATKKLPYSLGETGNCPAWSELVSTLYSDEERRKIEWAIGSVFKGDSKYIQKFLVFYGPAGTGKSTVLNIIQALFEGYYAVFDAKALGSSSGTFATEVFKDNPLVAIQHDGDLSKIEDNTKLNSIISHEEMTVNEKYKPTYTAKSESFLFMGTNTPVKISDAKSGLIRRLIDVTPTGKTLPADHYQELMNQVKFEYGEIARHCLNVYERFGRNYYNDYKPLSMMYKTDPVLGFVTDYYDRLKTADYITMKRLYSLYKEYCDESGIEKPLNRQRLQTEMENYYREFQPKYWDGEKELRSVFAGFDMDKVKPAKFDPDKSVKSIELIEQESIFDSEYGDCPAQLANDEGTPRYKWDNVRTNLSEIDTSELHYVKVPENHIVIDFDCKDESGNKSLEKNLEAASSWPLTYSETSKSGQGLHLHYIYDGDVSQLANEYDTDIEVKVYRGNSSLRRKLTKCNNESIAHISSGLPFKEKKMLAADKIQSEKGLRSLIARNLRKEIHPGTKPSVEFINHILDEAYESGLEYDVTDMRNDILAFASKSTNHAFDMIKLVKDMKFTSKEESEPVSEEVPVDDDRLVFFDIEVYPNHLIVCYKFEGNEQIVTMIDPSSSDVEQLFKYKLVGFNNRRYDNHILYARYLGYPIEELFKLSSKIVNNDRSGMFPAAYGISYADIYDFSSKKQSLKKFEIELGIRHMEMDIPWDEPVSDELLPKVIEYCKNDVSATEATFKARKSDFDARLILADLSGLTPNDTTQKHTAKILFGDDRAPQRSFEYTDLSDMFPGYTFDAGKSSYRDVDEVGEGGYVYAEPGLYKDVAVLDIASMHPSSIEALNLFGPYTKNFSELKAARIAIKHEEFDKARSMLDGKLAPYLKDTSDAKDLAYALKIVINIVYGLTSAKFENPFKDKRNKDNIVAKRGALFMIDLRHFVQEKGFQVVHIKTDSIKIPGATPEIIKEVTEFGKKFGYDFEHEATYDSMCLVNDAVYISRTGDKWEAVGAQFQHPYVYKTLFTGEDISFKDYVETRQVAKGVIALDVEGTENDPVVLGRIGTFVPVKPGTEGAGRLLRLADDKSYALAGTKGYLWLQEEIAKELGEDVIDKSYAEKLKVKAKKEIEKHGKFEELFPDV